MSVAAEASKPGKIRQFFSRAWRKVKSLFTKSNVRQGAVLIGTSVLSWIVLQAFVPLWLTAMVFSVITTHEFAHYFSALRRGQLPHLPWFLPLGPVIFGVTHVEKEDPIEGQQIALAGPLVGIVLSFFWAMWAAVRRFRPGIYSALYILGFQLFTSVFGADGRRYRRFSKEIASAREVAVVPG